MDWLNWLKPRTRWFAKNSTINIMWLHKRRFKVWQTPAQGYANACRALAYADLRDEIAQIQIRYCWLRGQKIR